MRIWTTATQMHMHTKKLCLPDSHLAYLQATYSPPKCGKQSSFSLWSSLNLVHVAAPPKGEKFNTSYATRSARVLMNCVTWDFRSAFPILVTSLYYLCFQGPLSYCSLVPRPFPPPVFDCTLYAKTEVPEEESWGTSCASPENFRF